MELIRFTLERAGVKSSVLVFPDGDRAFTFIDEIDAGAAASPGLFILDFNLPKRPGRDVLERIRRSPVCAGVPVVVLSSSSAEADKREAARLGANRYITKPSDLDEFLRIGGELKRFIEHD